MLLVKGHSLAAWENISLKYPMQVECWAAYSYWLLLSRNCFGTNYSGKAALGTTVFRHLWKQSPACSAPAASAPWDSHGSFCPFQEELISQASGPSLYHLPSALDQRLPHSVFQLHSVFPFCFCLSQTKEITKPLLWKAEGSQAPQFQHNQNYRSWNFTCTLSFQITLNGSRKLLLRVKSHHGKGKEHQN